MWKSYREPPSKDIVCLARLKNGYKYVEYNSARKVWVRTDYAPLNQDFDYLELDKEKLSWTEFKDLTDPKITIIGASYFPETDTVCSWRSEKVIVNIKDHHPVVGWFDFEVREWRFIEQDAFENSEVIAFSKII